MLDSFPTGPGGIDEERIVARGEGMHIPGAGWDGEMPNPAQVVEDALHGHCPFREDCPLLLTTLSDGGGGGVMEIRLCHRRCVELLLGMREKVEQVAGGVVIINEVPVRGEAA